MEIGNLQNAAQEVYCQDTGKEMTMRRCNWFLITSEEIEQIRERLLDPGSGEAAGEALKQEILGIIDGIRNRQA
jgi:hypothetical protein